MQQRENVKAAQSFGSSWAKFAREHNGCKVCQRKFATEPEKETFIARFEGSECAAHISFSCIGCLCA